MKRNVILTFFIGSILVTGIFFYDVIFFNKTLLSTGTTAGIMGNDGPYHFLENTHASTSELSEKFTVFRKDLGATAWQAEPHQIKNLESIRKFSWPLWNDNNAAGKPQAANFISNPWFPIKLIVYLIPNSTGWDIYLMSRFVLGIFFTALFLREMKLHALPSFIGGILFGFSGYFILFQNITDMDVGLLTPVFFWVAAYSLSLARAPTIKVHQYIATVLALAGLLLANIPEPLLLVIAAGSIFWLTRLIQAALSDRPYFYRAIKVSAQVILPAGLLVLPQYLLNYELVQNSISVTHAVSNKVGLFAYSFDYILFYVFPFLHVNPYLLPLKPTSNQVFNYIGVGVFFLAVFGAITGVIKRNIGIFFLLLFLVCLGKDYGIPSFLHHFIGEAPGFGRIFFPKYIQPLISFAAAGLAAVGLQGLMSKTISKKDFWFALFMILGLLLIGLLLILPFTKDGWVENFTDILALNKKIFIGHLAILSVVAFGLIKNSTTAKLTTTLVLIMGVVVSAELWLLLPRNYPTRYDSFTQAPYVSWLQSQPKPFRIFGFDRLMFPELASALELDDIRTLDVLYIKQYYLYIQNFISPDIYDRFIGTAEGPNEASQVRYLNNPLFDLLNVKYILAKLPPLELFPANAINDAIFEANAPTSALRITTFSQNGDFRKVFFEHPPSTACVSLSIEPEKSWLKFSTALDQEIWAHPGNDGVDFEIRDGAGHTLFSFTQNPAEQVTDQRWIDHAIDLSPLAGQQAELCFITKPRGNSAADYAGWADLRLVPKDKSIDTTADNQYLLVYDGEVKIYENTHAYPRGFLVGSVDVVHDDASAIAALQSTEFNPRQEAVITLPAETASIPPLDGEACQTVIEDYQRPNPNTITMRISSPGQCFLVFSESNYPGWVAKVDNQTTPIYQTDLMLQGILVGPGEHNVIFMYHPRSFYLGLLGALLGCILMAYWSRKNYHTR